MTERINDLVVSSVATGDRVELRFRLQYVDGLSSPGKQLLLQNKQ